MQHESQYYYKDKEGVEWTLTNLRPSMLKPFIIAEAEHKSGQLRGKPRTQTLQVYIGDVVVEMGKVA